MMFNLFNPPNFDLIHQRALSAIASSDFYDQQVNRYTSGECTAEQLADALEQFQNDGADLCEACRKVEEKSLLIATNDSSIYVLTLDHYFAKVEVKKALNISGGLDEMAVKQTLNV